MTLSLRRRALRALLALPLSSLPVSAFASGFAVEDVHGARAMGMGGAILAQSVDPSVLRVNPAGIAFLKGRQIYVGGAFGKQSTDFTGAGPYPARDTLESAQQGIGILPVLYYSQALGERAVVGLGVDRPFAMRNEWQGPERATGRFHCLVCEVDSWAVRPTLALKLADRFAIGGGADVRFSKLEIVRRMAASQTPLRDGAEQSLLSETTPAVSWNAGILASPSEAVSIGLSYRHKAVVTHDVTVTNTQILTGDSTLDAAVKANLPKNELAEAAFTYPASIQGGVVWRGDRVTLEADLSRTLWTDFDAIVLSFRSSPTDSRLPTAFGDTWAAAVGVEYQLRDEVELRGGYRLEGAAQPDSTLSPIVADSRGHGFSVGGSYKTEMLRVDAAVRMLLRGSRTTDGRNRYGYEGVYDPGVSFAFGVSLGYRF